MTQARQAVEISENTDLLNMRGNVLMDLAEVLILSNQSVEAVPIVRQALQLYEQKGNIVSAAKARAVLYEQAR
jgi:hypothetical protein